MIIRNVFPPATMEAVVARLLRGESRIPGNASPYYVGRTFGRILPREQDPPAGGVFPGGGALPRRVSRPLPRAPRMDFQARFEEVLGMMAGGRAVRVPVNAAGQTYQPWSIREMLPGGEIDLHYEDEAFDSPTMSELRSMIDRPHQMSAYLALQVPERGGELSLYPLGEGDPEAIDLKTMARKSERIYSRIEEMAPRHALLAGVGDLLLFDAGRFFHRVTRVEGTRARWTMGSFITLAGAGDCYYYFA